jgi:hypothetical protein
LEVQALNPLQVWNMPRSNRNALNSCSIRYIRMHILSYELRRNQKSLQLEAAKRTVGPLVQSAMRYKQQRVRKRLETSNAEDFPPLHQSSILKRTAELCGCAVFLLIK